MDWTLDRIQTLSKPEVKQLRANAERLQEPGVVALCDKVLGSKTGPAGAVAARPAKAGKPRKESQGD
ncbi:MAG TPA: hypothetical protein VLV90_06545 [Burkholderiales bacterium]|nr:hypothetical protein [Burkholderiales bacterium]